MCQCESLRLNWWESSVYTTKTFQQRWQNCKQWWLIRWHIYTHTRAHTHTCAHTHTGPRCRRKTTMQQQQQQRGQRKETRQKQEWGAETFTSKTADIQFKQQTEDQCGCGWLLSCLKREGMKPNNNGWYISTQSDVCTARWLLMFISFKAKKLFVLHCCASNQQLLSNINFKSHQTKPLLCVHNTVYCSMMWRYTHECSINKCWGDNSCPSSIWLCTLCTLR